MTAIAGLWRFDGSPAAVEGCERMLAAQALYGPHAVAQWSDGAVSLGRQLMRLLPEDAHDRQPVVGGAGRYVLVADVRLDNRDELSGMLNIAAPHGRNLSDAAMLLAVIERWGENCFEHLVGDYAFALWNGPARRMLLARDPLGQRPLHYHRGNGVFAFASMPKGLHALAEIPYAVDEERAAEFLSLLDTGSGTLFRGIERVESGHAVTVTVNGVAARRHWNPSRRRIFFKRSNDYADALRAHLDQAVRCRLRGAEIVGAHLSSGFDSSAVAATAARLLGPSGGKVIAFTAVPRKGYAESSGRLVNEGPHAAATAALYPNMTHVTIRDESISPLDILDRHFYLFDQPALSICNAGWWYAINDAARMRKLKVLLTGESGNMGLSYDGMELLPELFRSGRWFRLFDEARALVAQNRLTWRMAISAIFGAWCPAGLWLWVNRVRGRNTLDSRAFTAIHPRRFAELDLATCAKARNFDLVNRPWKDGFAMRLWGLRAADPGNYNKGILGGWQIDQRDPTADVRLLEFCLATPTEQFLKNGTPRALARRALADRLPNLVLEETRSGRQAADWHERLTAARDGITAELDRLERCAPASRVIDFVRLRRLVANWPSSGWERGEIAMCYRYALLRGISIGHFLRRIAGSNLECL